jgi:hypothetical protein
MSFQYYINRHNDMSIFKNVTIITHFFVGLGFDLFLKNLKL